MKFVFWTIAALLLLVPDQSNVVLSRLRSGLPTLLGSLSFEGHALPGSGLCNKP